MGGCKKEKKELVNKESNGEGARKKHKKEKREKRRN